jgi:hypothetical protein
MISVCVAAELGVLVRSKQCSGLGARTVHCKVTGWGWASSWFRQAARYCCIGLGLVQHPNNFLNIEMIQICTICNWYF